VLLPLPLPLPAVPSSLALLLEVLAVVEAFPRLPLPSDCLALLALIVHLFAFGLREIYHLSYIFIGFFIMNRRLLIGYPHKTIASVVGRVLYIIGWVGGIGKVIIGSYMVFNSSVGDAAAASACLGPARSAFLTFESALKRKDPNDLHILRNYPTLPPHARKLPCHARQGQSVVTTL